MKNIFFLFFFMPGFLLCQQVKIDSMQNLINNAKEDTNKVSLLETMGFILRYKDPENAKKYCDTALALAEKLNYKIGKAQVYSTVGVININQGKYSLAVESLLKGLKLMEEIDNSRGIAILSNNLANSYYYMGKFDLCEKYYLKALERYKAVKDTSGMANTNMNIAIINAEQKKPEKSIDYFLQAQIFFEAIHDKGGVALCLTNTGIAYYDMKKYDEALNYLNKAMIMSMEVEDPFTSGLALLHVGLVNDKLGKSKQAIPNFKAAIDIGEKQGFKYIMKEAYGGLSQAYAHLGEYKLAYEAHKQYSEIKDTLLNEESHKQIAEMQTKYETEKKEQQITLLNKDKEIQDAEVRRQRIIIWSVAGGFLIVLVLSIFIFRERKKSEKLLLNILPAETAKELKRNGKATPRHYESVTVMFTDFKGFTQIAEKLSAEELVSELDFIFRKFDEIISKYNIEKIKTIGDAYMCVSGLPVPNSNHAEEIVKASLEIQNWMQEWQSVRQSTDSVTSFGAAGSSSQSKLPTATVTANWSLRIGIHSGPVTAGVVGDKKFAYDIWGDTVNTASRMESSGEAGKINISGSTYELLKRTKDEGRVTGEENNSLSLVPCPLPLSFTFRGKIPAKNKGEIDMYFVEKLT